MVELDQRGLELPTSSEFSVPSVRLRLEAFLFFSLFEGVSITRHWSIVWQSIPARTHNVQGRLMSHYKGQRRLTRDGGLCLL
jgi:hypothetical protein